MSEEKRYLEVNLPAYLQHDIDALKVGLVERPLHLDCLLDEVQGSINSAEVDGLISSEQAAYLRAKYLWEME
mgnify:FL=1